MNVKYQHFSEGTLRRRLGDAISPAAIVQIYLEESPRLIQDLALERDSPKNLDSLAACTHRLKGSLAMLCATPATEIAEHLIKACRRDDSVAALALCDQLLTQLRSLKVELERYVETNESI